LDQPKAENGVGTLYGKRAKRRTDDRKSTNISGCPGTRTDKSQKIVKAAQSFGKTVHIGKVTRLITTNSEAESGTSFGMVVA